MGLLWRTWRASWLMFRILVVFLIYRYGKRFSARNEVGTKQAPPSLGRWRAKQDVRYAEKLYRLIVDLRGVYIKLGQVLSIMGGFLPRVYTEKLESLQDAVPPRPSSEIRTAIANRLGKSTEELFASFSEAPLAAASLGQVHKALTLDGQQVAVKTLYPGIRAIIKADMRVIGWGVKIYKLFVPVDNIESIHGALVDLLQRETDYLKEAESMKRVANNFKNEAQIVCPIPIESLSCADVLTMTYMEGVKVNDFEELERLGIERTELATLLVKAFYKQLFIDRFFHADPHPGNFFARKNEEGKTEVVILDFGAIWEVREELIDGLTLALRSYLEKDESLLLEGVERIGFVAEGGNRELLKTTIEKYFAKLLDMKNTTPRALMEASPEELEELANPEVARRELRGLMKSVRYPEGWFYVERASVLMFWLSAQLAPDLDTVKVGMPYVLPLMMKKKKNAGAA